MLYRKARRRHGLTVKVLRRIGLAFVPNLLPRYRDRKALKTQLGQAWAQFMLLKHGDSSAALVLLYEYVNIFTV